MIKLIEVDQSYIDKPAVWLNKGAALYELGSYEEAIKYTDKALQVNITYVKAWYR